MVNVYIINSPTCAVLGLYILLLTVTYLSIINSLYLDVVICDY